MATAAASATAAGVGARSKPPFEIRVLVSAIDYGWTNRTRTTIIGDTVLSVVHIIALHKRMEWLVRQTPTMFLSPNPEEVALAHALGVPAATLRSGMAAADNDDACAYSVGRLRPVSASLLTVTACCGVTRPTSSFGAVVWPNSMRTRSKRGRRLCPTDR